LTVYRVVQEALTNVVKHAPGARAAVALSVSDCEILLDVTDDGAPAGLAAAGESGHGGLLLGGRGALGIPPMPTWAMISVIAGWIIGWSAIGAWRMMTRDA
jgi:anti-sigma regulatory factor (Ser/Thr protein kinase)